MIHKHVPWVPGAQRGQEEPRAWERGFENALYLEESTKDGKAIRLVQGVAQVWVLDVKADKVDLLIENKPSENWLKRTTLQQRSKPVKSYIWYFGANLPVN